MKNIFDQDYFIYPCKKVSDNNNFSIANKFNRRLNRQIKVKNMIKVYNGNIFDFLYQEQIDTIINAANGTGPMGAGIAGAIKKHGGKEIQIDAYKQCRELNPKVGDSYITTSGRLLSKGINQIVHAVTMKSPGGNTSYKIIREALQSSLNNAVSLKSKKVVCPGLGTGIGGLDPKKVAIIMYDVAALFLDKLDIIFIDLNKSFTDKIDELLRDNI